MYRILPLIILIVNIISAAELPFQRGVNLTQWFQAAEPQQIHFTQFTRTDFENIQSLGCDVIRLPINLHAMTDGAPEYTPDPLFLHMLDQVVNWAEELNLHLILDNHTFDPAVNTSPDIETVLVPVWMQMAEHYQHAYGNIYYEILNEPHGIADSTWNRIQQTVIDSIRSIDSTHTIVIGPAEWNSYNNLKYMPDYDDENLIYTFHFYAPHVFTHQGATWGSPSLGSLAGVPFPFDAARMPETPSDLKGTWVEWALNDYSNQGSAAYLQQQMQTAAKFKNERDIPIFCGEFGVYMRNADSQDRVRWYETVRTLLDNNNIGWTMWDYTGGFGLFEKNSSELFDYDLNVPLLQALNLNVPPQKTFENTPDSSGFSMYTDHISENIRDASWVEGPLSFYHDTAPYSGDFCIYWADANQYNHLRFDFKPDKNLVSLIDQAYALDFYVRGDTPGTSFDMRFIDTKTEKADDQEWRMRVTVTDSLAAWDNTWQHVQIPLSQFTEHGAWDGSAWHNPQGDFDWAAVDVFEIVAEQKALTGAQLWFDEIRILDPAATGIEGHSNKIDDFSLYPNFPNPFNPQTTIRYHLQKTAHVSIQIFNASGRLVSTLRQDRQSPGTHSVIWDGRDHSGRLAASGVYVCRLQSNKQTKTQKVLLIR
ncbi:MAG: cellulase family glycosylhydrolase [candidate division KSB1 bacterium]|nr:cellulase family glycosylhydrolase [candidate division KSB1 bacterium]